MESASCVDAILTMTPWITIIALVTFVTSCVGTAIALKVSLTTGPSVQEWTDTSFLDDWEDTGDDISDLGTAPVFIPRTGVRSDDGGRTGEQE